MNIFDNLKNASAENILKWAMEKFHPEISLASSFSIEDVIISHMLRGIRNDFRVFAIDTGRLNEETYQCADAIVYNLGISIDWYFPQHEAIEKLVREQGLFSFRKSAAARKECCRIRKVETLGRALTGLKAWITGLRREQSLTRGNIEKIEKDEINGGIIKVNPLADWTTEQAWDYVRKNNLPYNHLYHLGYQSIGCAPCTRAVKQGEDSRAGRWWWEDKEHKECGLHIGKTGSDIK